MKKNYLFFGLFILLFIDIQGSTYPVRYERIENTSQIPRVLQFAENQGVPWSLFETWLSTTYKLTSGLGWRVIREETDQIEMRHIRLQQTWFGIDIVGADIVVHIKGNLVTGFNGLAFEQFELGNPAPAIGHENALQKVAENYFGPAELWDEKGTAVYAPINGSLLSKDYKFSYRFQATHNELKKGEKFFVSYPDFKIIWAYPTLCEADSSGKGKTGFRGWKDIVTDYVSANSNFRTVNNAENFEIRNKNTSSTPFLNDSNTWLKTNLDSFALDAHWATDQTWKFYKNWHGRNSMNNNGFKLICVVHDGNYINAFWNGTYAAFGDGNVLSGGSVQPLVSLDVVGHEFAHGFTQYTCGLVYAYEPGALNESFSDIMGKAIEYYADSASGKFSWNLPDDIGMIFRDMKNPNTRSMPKYYKGRYWYTGAGDNGGVHYNSSLFNHWFYLLADGDSGTNEVGYTFKVDSIGFFKASSLAYRLQAYYLTSNSQYPDAGDYAWMAAADLFGYCSKEYNAVIEALKTIGLPPKPGSPGWVETGNHTPYLISGGNQQVVFQVRVHQECNPTQQDTVKKLFLNFSGSTKMSNLSNIQVYYTSGIPRFSNSTYFGTGSLSGYQCEVTGSQPISLGVNRFWVVADIAGGSNGGDIVDGGCDSILKNQNYQKAYTPNPPGYRIIMGCKPRHTVTCNSLRHTQIIVSGQNLKIDTNCTAQDSGYRAALVPVNLEKGTTHSLEVAYKNNVGGIKVYLYADLNRNGVFTNSGELLSSAIQNTGNRISLSFPINSNVNLGSYLFRIYLVPSTASVTPCLSGTNYETIDFLANIGPDVTINPMRICLGQSSQLSATLDSTIRYQWKVNNQIVSDKTGANGGNIYTLQSNYSGALKILLTSIQPNGDYINSKEYTLLVFDTMSKPSIYPASQVNVCSKKPELLYIDSTIFNPAIQRIRIMYNAAAGQTSLTGLSKLYMHAGITDTNIAGKAWRYTVGNWAADDNIGKMIKRTNNYWEFNINPLEYFSPDRSSELKYLALIFRDSSGNLTGKDNNGQEIFIDLRSLKSSFSGITATLNQDYYWFKDGQPIPSARAASLPVDSGGTYEVQIHTVLCHATSHSATVTEYNSNTPGIWPGNTGVCLGDSLYINVIQSSGNLSIEGFDSATGNWQYLTSQAPLTLSPKFSGLYRIKASSSTCSDSIGVPFTVNVSQPFAPALPIRQKDSVCLGQPILANYPSSFDAIEWEWYDGQAWQSSGITAAHYSPIFNQSTFIRARVTQGFCTRLTDSIYFSIFPNPKAGNIYISKNPVCKGENAILTMPTFVGLIKWQYFDAVGFTWQDLGLTGDSVSYSPQIQQKIRGLCFNPGCQSISISPEIQVNLLLPPHADTIQGPNQEICRGDSILIGWVPRMTQSFIWMKDGNIYSETKSETFVKDSGEYWLQLKGINGCEALSQKITVHVNPLPVLSQISRNWNFLYVDSAITGVSASWARNGVNLQHPWFGIHPQKEGVYTLTLKSNKGCISESDYNFLYSGIKEAPFSTIKIFPNPSSDQVTIISEHPEQLAIFNALGQLMNLHNIQGNTRIDIKEYPAGLYYIRLINRPGCYALSIYH